MDEVLRLRIWMVGACISMRLQQERRTAPRSNRYHRSNLEHIVLKNSITGLHSLDAFG